MDQLVFVKAEYETSFARAAAREGCERDASLSMSLYEPI